MQRRRFLQLGIAATALTAGCSTPDADTVPTSAQSPGTPTRTGTPTPTPADDGGVYVQPFVEGMATPGRTTAGEYAIALHATVPHRFWTITGRQRSAVPRTDADTLHLMAVVWDPETGVVLPETGLSVELSKDAALVSEEVIYPMLSQRMGVHYGGNFGLDGDGTYVTAVSVGGSNVRRTGAFRDRFSDPATGEIEFTLDDAFRERIDTREVDQAGQPGAVAPMQTGFPIGRAPAEADLPGQVLGTTSSGDARFVVTLLDEPPAGVDATRSDSYLAVSARTPYNRLVLPAMALSATLSVDGNRITETALTRTLDPALHYHYGATVAESDLASTETLRLTVDTPPQVARHEGYETAFLTMPPATLDI
jgi:hypothetical protein